MTLLPIVERELRVASRRSLTYWSRVSTAAATLVVSMVVLRWIGGLVATQFLSQVLFQSLIWFVFLYSLLVGVRITADCISVEKRDGTLGLLFLTDLKGYDVALGKLAATSLPAFYGLAASVPVLAIPLLLGGVSAGEFWRATLVLLNTLFFSLSGGMLVSAFSRDERKAAAAAVLLILLIAGGLPLLGFVHLMYLDSRGVPVQTRGFVPTALFAYVLPSPAFACFLAFDRFYAGAARAFWGSVAITHAMGWIFLATVSWVLPRIWQDRPSTAWTLRWRERLRQWFQGTAARRARSRARRLSRNPVYWLATRNWVKAVDIWFILLAVMAGWCWGFHKLRGEWLNVGISTGTALVLQMVLKYWAAGAASSPLVEELRTGTLELLLSTPLSVGEILRGRFLALRRQLAGPTIAVLVVGGLLWWGTPDWRTAGSADNATMLAGIVASVLMLGADLFTLVWVGMWMGLSSTNARKAAGGTVLRVLILPWLVLGVIGSTWAYLSWKFHWTYSPGPRVLLGMWFVIGMVVDLGFWQWSRNRLRAEFRTRAMHRYLPDATASIWYQLGKRFARWRLAASRPTRRASGY